MIEELNQMFEEVNFGKQTTFQNVYFVVEKSGITIWGKYCQALRELQSRIDNYKIGVLKLEDDKIKYLELEEKTSQSELKQRKKRLKMIALSDSIQQKEKELKSMIVDIEVFYKMAMICREELLKKYKKLTSDVINNLEKEYWYKKFRTMAAFDVLNTGHISTGLWDNILSLPTDVKQKILTEIKPANIGAVIDECTHDEEDFKLTKEKIQSSLLSMDSVTKQIDEINKKYLS